MMLRRLLNGDLAHFVVIAAYKDGIPIGPLVRKSLFETFLWDSVTKN